MGSNEILKKMGERIYKRRKALKITQEELAESIGVSTQMISNLELGKKAIRPENLIKISCALQISTDYILTGNCEQSNNIMANKISALSANERELLNKIVDYMLSEKTEAT